jgi:large subunit ribosomal protein L4
MASVDVKDASGKKAGTVELDDAIFGVQVNVPVMHQVVTAQLAARRSGTQSTKTRAEVRGGGAKPWRQKGTGRARQGSSRSPHWVGGGVSHAPKPRSYAQKTPKKMIRLALRSALSDRASDGKVIVLDSWGIEAPSTKAAIKVLDSLTIDGRVMVVLDREDEATWKSLRNLPGVHVLVPGELNAYDVLVSDYVVFTRSSLPTSTEATKPAATKASEPVAETAVSVSGKAGEGSASDEPAAERSLRSEAMDEGTADS